MRQPAVRPDMGTLGRLVLGIAILAVLQHVLGTVAFVVIAIFFEIADPGGITTGEVAP